MLHLIKKLLTTHLLLKIVCVLLAYGLWTSINKNRVVTRSFNVPLCFYNTKQGLSINAPEIITVTLQGQWEILRHIASEHLAAHINGDHLTQGDTPLAINATHLLLPESVKLVHYSPLPVIISIKHHGYNEQTTAL